MSPRELQPGGGSFDGGGNCLVHLIDRGGGGLPGEAVVGRIAALDQLQQFLSAGVPSGVVFLLSASEIDKRRSFYKSITKLATVEHFDRIDTSRSGWEEEAGCPDGRA